MALGYFGYPYTQVIFRASAGEGLGYRLLSIIIDYRLLSILPIDKNQSTIDIDWYRVYRLISDIDFYRSTTPVSLATSCNNSSRRQITPCEQVGQLLAATRWGDRHDAATNHDKSLRVSGEFLWKSLSPQRDFVPATNRKKTNKTESVRLVVVTKFCCSDKDFHKNSPVHTKRFVAAMCCLTVLLQLVA